MHPTPQRLYKAGISLRRVRSPLAPKITSVQRSAMGKAGRWSFCSTSASITGVIGYSSESSAFQSEWTKPASGRSAR